MKRKIRENPRRVRKHVNPLSVQAEFAFDGFKNNQKTFVDVGAGHGVFAKGLREKFKNHNLVLFEIRLPINKKLQEAFTREPNVQVFSGDAGRNFHSICGKLDLAGVFINFPDPWPKDRPKKTRFVNEKWLTETHEWIKPGVPFYFQTDHAGLFADTMEVLKDSDFEIEKYAESPFGIQTHWESAKIAEGSEIFRVRFWKP